MSIEPLLVSHVGGRFSGAMTSHQGLDLFGYGLHVGVVELAKTGPILEFENFYPNCRQGPPDVSWTWVSMPKCSEEI